MARQLGQRRPERPAATRVHVLAVTLVVVATLGACSTPAAETDADTVDDLAEAVEQTRSAYSFRVRGYLGAAAAGMRWEGAVVGTDEQYEIAAMGMMLDVRRIDGVAWSQPLDRSQAWISARSDESFDLGVLVRGQVTASHVVDGQGHVEVHFLHDDVLKAFSHVPSVGATEATVRIESGYVSDVDLRLGGGAIARLHLWDFGAPLVIGALDAADFSAA